MPARTLQWNNTNGDATAAAAWDDLTTPATPASAPPADGDTLDIAAFTQEVSTPLSDAGAFAFYIESTTEPVVTDFLANLATTQSVSTIDVAGVDASFLYDSTKGISGAVTLSDHGALSCGGSFTCIGGITITDCLGAGLVLIGHTITSDVVMAGATLCISSGTIVGNIIATASGNNINDSDGVHNGFLTGTVNLANHTCQWSITSTITVTINDASTLSLGTQTFVGVEGVSGLIVVIDAAGLVVTAGHSIECGTFTLTDGTYAAGAYNHTIYGTVLQSAGTLTATGTWTMAATGTLTITDAIAGAQVTVSAGTTTLGAALSCASIRIEAGATLDCDSNSVVLANSASANPLIRGRVTGFGTLTNCVPAATAIHVAPTVTDGGGNSADVIFDPWPTDQGLDL